MYLLSMLHYFAVILHDVIFMLVSFVGNGVTNILGSVIAFRLQFHLKIVFLLTYKVMFSLCV
jgi:hypothetical protein